MAEAKAGVESFGYAPAFEAGETSGGMRLGRFMTMYEEMFSEVIEDGVITEEERARLDKMAENFGLDRDRLGKLEQALVAAYEAKSAVVVTEATKDLYDGRASLVPFAPPDDIRSTALIARIQVLETRVLELEKELTEARAHQSVDVDFSDVSKSSSAEDVEATRRRLARDPRDTDSLHLVFDDAMARGNKEEAFRYARVLAHLGAAKPAERAIFDAQKSTGPIRPSAAASSDAWRRLVFHPEEEPIVGDIFGVVVGAVLVGRVSALRRDKQLEAVDPKSLQDARESTIASVRSMGWAHAILGMPAPKLAVDPDRDTLAETVVALPPVIRLGGKMLSGRSPRELAFIAGYYAALMREEHYVRTLVPSAKGLEQIFLAALSIGNPGLPLAPHLKESVVPIAQAISPLLDTTQIDRLRGFLLRFVEEGGRTNLARWVTAMEKTCARAGFVLCDDFDAAKSGLTLLGVAVEPTMDDLYAFSMSDRLDKLRKQLGT